MRSGAAGLLAGLLLAACAPVAHFPAQPVPYGTGVVIHGTPVPLDPGNPARDRIGNFIYAGGLSLASTQTSRLHGLSDLKVWPNGRFLAQGDQADQVEGRLVLDAHGRLAGVADAHIRALKEMTGVDLYAGGQREFDIEGVAELANGDRLLSFEQHDRLYRYAKVAELPVPAPFPDRVYVHNEGMEALAADPSVGPDAYRVGIEPTGEIFLCRVSAACVKTGQVDLEGLELVGMEHLPGGRWAYLLRSFSILRGNVIRLNIVGPDGRKIDGMELARPLTVDNFEGVGAVPGQDGSIRFYIVADDNFGQYNGKPTDQRTLLLAFDWRPKKGRAP